MCLGITDKHGSLVQCSLFEAFKISFLFLPCLVVAFIILRFKKITVEEPLKFVFEEGIELLACHLFLFVM